MTPSPPGTPRPKVRIPALEHLHAIDLPTPFRVGPVTVYFTDAPGEPLTFVNTGPHTAATQKALEIGLAHLGHAPADLARILITHAHVDHVGLAASLVTARLFPSRSPLDTFLAVSEVIGHLDLLEMEGKIVGAFANGIRLWNLPEV